MNEQTTFLRASKGFTKVSNTLLRSKLSITAIGLLAKLISYKDFVVHKETEQVKSGVGEKTFKKAWKELEDMGFIKTERIGGGKFRYKYTIINDPNLIEEERTEPGAESQSRKTIPENPEVENQECESRDVEGVTNIDVTNLDLKNQEVSNLDENKLDETTLGKIDPVGSEGGTVEVISDNDSSITSKDPVQSLEQNDDWVERLKQKVRKYVIDNKIEIDYVSQSIQEFYDLKVYIPDNIHNLSEEKLFSMILHYTRMDKMHNTNRSNSIQKLLLKRIEEYIQEYSINRSLAEVDIQRYITDDYFLCIDQNSNLDKEFDRFLLYSRLSRYCFTLKDNNVQMDI